MGPFWPEALQTQPGPAAQQSRPAHGNGASCVRLRGNHRSRDLSGGAAGGVEKDVEAGQGEHGEDLWG
jgi:hypothetical protein